MEANKTKPHCPCSMSRRLQQGFACVALVCSRNQHGTQPVFKKKPKLNLVMKESYHSSPPMSTFLLAEGLAPTKI